MKRFLILTLAAAVWASPLTAVEYRADPGQSSLRFEARPRFGGGAGEFHRFDVAAEVDEANLENSRFEVTIDIGSIDTGIKKRDHHLRSPDFFDAEKHPSAVFKTLRLTPEGAGLYRVSGELTLRGVTKPLDFPAAVKDRGNGYLAVSGETSLNRREFGIRYDSRLNPIQDTVKVIFDLRLVRK